MCGSESASGSWSSEELGASMTGVSYGGGDTEVTADGAAEEVEEARSSPTARTRLMMECRRGCDADLRVSCALMGSDMRVAVLISSSYGTGTYAAIGNCNGSDTLINTGQRI